MAKQTINIGAVAGDGTGDPLRTALDKVNDNFDELYSTAISNATQTALDLKAPLASPALTGTPTAPTASPADNSTKIATTAYADAAAAAAAAALVASAPGALDTLNELAAALGDDANFAATVTTALSGKAATTHTHAQSDVTGLVDALAALLPKAGGTMTGALAITAGALNTSPLAVSQTWNNAGVTCRGFEHAVTDTNSAADSTLMRLLGGAAGTSAMLQVGKIGSLTLGDFGVSNSVFLLLNGSDRTGQIELPTFSNGIAAVGSLDVKGNNGTLRMYNGNSTVQYGCLYGEEEGVIALRTANGAAVGAAWEMLEMTAPGTPDANRLRLYVEDNGSGKTRLVVKFSDGTTAVLATQP